MLAYKLVVGAPRGRIDRELESFERAFMKGFRESP